MSKREDTPEELVLPSPDGAEWPSTSPVEAPTPPGRAVVLDPATVLAPAETDGTRAKAAPTKKSTVKKATVKKATVKKSTAKKATVKKSTAKKATVKKATPRRSSGKG